MRLKQTAPEETTTISSLSTARETFVVPPTDGAETLASLHVAGHVARTDSRYAVSPKQGVKDAVCFSLSVLLTVLSVIALTGFAFLCCLYFAFEMPVPLSVLRVAVGTFSIGSLFCLFPVRRQKAIRYLATVAGMLLLAGVTWIPNGSPRQRFLMRFEFVQPGMSVAEVRERLGSYYPYIGPGSGCTGTFHIGSHTPNDGRYNADCAHMTFENGRVVSKGFLPD
jgi:hypothetical protein